MANEFEHRGVRRVGDTEVTLPAIGMGAAAIGNLYRAMSDEAAQATIGAALQGGVAYFDTAPHYGFGLSEQRLGAMLPRGVCISTKVGRRLVPVDPSWAREARHGFVDAAPYEPVFDYSYDGVRSAFDASLRRLGIERVDVLFAHDLGVMTHGDAHEAHFRQFLKGGYRAMCELKAEGRVGAVGVGVNEIEVCLQLLGEVQLDCILLAGRYTLLEQEALTELLPATQAKRVSLIVGGPFNSGILAEYGGGEGARHYNYELAPAPIVERVRRLAEVCAAHATPLAAAALQFPLGHPSVVSVIPGLGSPAQVQDALRFHSFDIPPALWDDLRTEGLIRPDAPAPARRLHA